MAKAMGVEIKDFWDKGWPSNDWYYESEGYEIDDEQGAFILELNKEYDLSEFGYLCWQGTEDNPRKEEWLFEEAFLEWKGMPETKRPICLIIPGKLKESFISFLELAINDVFLSHMDLTDSEIATIELLIKFCQKHKE